jgi:hypothetical protein
VTDFLTDKRKEIDARLAELKAVVDEYNRLARLGRQKLHGWVIFSGRDGCFGDAGLEGLLECAPGAGEGRALGDLGGECGVELGE